MNRTTALVPGIGLTVPVLALSFTLLHYGYLRGSMVLLGITPVLIALTLRKARGCGGIGRC